MAIAGATSEVATLKQALVEAEKRAASERTEQEKYEAEVGKVRQELQALVKKHESLELDSKTRASELAVAIKMPSLPRSSPKRPSRSWMR